MGSTMLQQLDLEEQESRRGRLRCIFGSSHDGRTAEAEAEHRRSKRHSTPALTREWLRKSNAAFPEARR